MWWQFCTNACVYQSCTNRQQIIPWLTGMQTESVSTFLHIHVCCVLWVTGTPVPWWPGSSGRNKPVTVMDWFQSGPPPHKHNAADFLEAGYYKCRIKFCQETFWGSLSLHALISLPLIQFANWHMMTYIQNKMRILYLLHTVLFCWSVDFLELLRRDFCMIGLLFHFGTYCSKVKVCFRMPFKISCQCFTQWCSYPQIKKIWSSPGAL